LGVLLVFSYSASCCCYCSFYVHLCPLLHLFLHGRYGGDHTGHGGDRRQQPGKTTPVGLSFTMHQGMGGPYRFVVRLRTNDASILEQPLIVRSNTGPP